MSLYFWGEISKITILCWSIEKRHILLCLLEPFRCWVQSMCLSSGSAKAGAVDDFGKGASVTIDYSASIMQALLHFQESLYQSQLTTLFLYLSISPDICVFQSERARFHIIRYMFDISPKHSPYSFIVVGISFKKEASCIVVIDKMSSFGFFGIWIKVSTGWFQRRVSCHPNSSLASNNGWDYWDGITWQFSIRDHCSVMYILYRKAVLRSHAHQLREDPQ